MELLYFRLHFVGASCAEREGEWNRLLSLADNYELGPGEEGVSWDQRVSWFRSARRELAQRYASAVSLEKRDEITRRYARELAVDERLPLRKSANKAPACGSSVYELALRAVGFARAVHESVSEPRDAAAAEITESDRLSVLVTGAGPAGLLTALVAEATGRCDVLITEKRKRFSRRIWFDLTPATLGGSSVPQLFRWGVFNLTTGAVFNDGRSSRADPEREIASLQCNVLERSLLLVLETSRDEARARDPQNAISRGLSFTGFCEGASGAVKAVLSYESPSEVGGEDLEPCKMLYDRKKSVARIVSADIVFAADGRNSIVRARAGLDSMPQLQLEGRPSPGGLSQLTLILHFDGIKSGADGGTWTCPDFDETVGPYDTWRRVPGVTAAFKRMWWPYCEMQLLFSERAAREIETEGKEGASLERTLRQLFDLLRLRPRDSPSPSPPTSSSSSTASFATFSTSHALSSAVEVLLAEHHATVAHFGRIRIDRASAASALLEPGNVLVALRGDALVTAHYRLGIGVNEAFSGLPHVSKLLHDWPAPSSSTDALRAAARGAWDASISARSDTMVRRQLEAIYWEAFCGFIVWEDEPLRRDPMTGRFRAATASEQQMCAQSWEEERDEL